MKLTKADKALFMEWDHPESDLRQLEEAAKVTVYTMDGKKISTKKAIEVLGRETYLNGISRSAFHWSSYRENAEGEGVHFDSSKLFE